MDRIRLLDTCGPTAEHTIPDVQHLTLGFLIVVEFGLFVLRRDRGGLVDCPTRNDDPENQDEPDYR